MSSDGPAWGERPEPDAPRSAPAPQYPTYPGQAPESDLARAQHPVAPASSMPSATLPAAPPVAPSAEPAGWWVRVAAALVDFLVPFALTCVPFFAGFVVAFSGSRYDEATDTVTDVEPGGFAITGLAVVAFLAFDAWNRGLRVGYRGESLGKQLVGVRVVRRDGTVTGPLEGFFRWMISLFLQWTFVGLLVDLLWPLGNDARQTVHDLAVGTFPIRT